MRTLEGLTEDGELKRVAITPPGTQVINPAFDVTPASLITGFITEVGVIPATPEAIMSALKLP
ncbi:MAG: hypothetical protein HOL45_01655 [Chloroflexi bacterium]|nr:hypothetical protein [Chloroflexota bacterium]